MTPLHRFLLRFCPPALAATLLALAYALALFVLVIHLGREPAAILYLDVPGGS